jgi:voltage-gated potassium channel
MREKTWKERLYEIVSFPAKNDYFSILYDAFFIITIIFSLIPLCYKELTETLILIDRVCAGVFIVDYILRWITANDSHEKWGKWAFLLYPITPFAIIDLLSILPSLSIINSGLRLLRLLRVLKALRIFKLLRYSKRFLIVRKILKSQSKTLISVAGLILGYIIVAAMFIFHVEPDSFNNLFEAMYWSTTTVTRANYTGIAPVTWVGELVSMISSIIGLIIIALPTGIITGAYISEISRENN